jgi:hypothetical protein
MITTTYEQSKALWDAGVKIKTELQWETWELDFPRLAFRKVFNGIPAPTFTELVEWLKSKGYDWSFWDNIITIGKTDEYLCDFIVVELTESMAQCCMEYAKRLMPDINDVTDQAHQESIRMAAQSGKSAEKAIVGNPPLNNLQEEMIKAIRELAKQSTAPDKDTPDWIESDIKTGMKWMYNKLTGLDINIP